MSTIFGVLKMDRSIELVDDMLPDGYCNDDFVEIAFRGNGGGGGSWVAFVNDLAKYLPDDIKVYPLNNTAQGIYTIGDIKREM